MVILKAHSKKESNKFIGAFLPQWIFSYFAIYTLAKSVSKSEVVREIIECWIKSQRQIVSDEELVKEIIQKVKLEWKLERLTNTSSSLTDFKANLRAELKSRCLDILHIEMILKEIE